MASVTAIACVAALAVVPVLLALLRMQHEQQWVDLDPSTFAREDLDAETAAYLRLGA